MSANTVPDDGGTSRRDMLKRGAIVGAAVWVAPLVEVVGMTPAHADSLSGGGPPAVPPQTPILDPSTAPPTTTATVPTTPTTSNTAAPGPGRENES